MTGDELRDTVYTVPIRLAGDSVALLRPLSGTINRDELTLWIDQDAPGDARFRRTARATIPLTMPPHTAFVRVANLSVENDTGAWSGTATILHREDTWDFMPTKLIERVSIYQAVGWTDLIAAGDTT